MFIHLGNSDLETIPLCQVGGLKEAQNVSSVKSVCWFTGLGPHLPRLQLRMRALLPPCSPASALQAIVTQHKGVVCKLKKMNNNPPPMFVTV
eukprot:1271639-Amphidinium_carterae.1